MAEQFHVLNIIKQNNKTIGAELIDNNTRHILTVYKIDFIKLRGKLDNAIITSNGILRRKEANKKEIYTPINTIKSAHTKVNRYIIMYKEQKVLKFNREKDSIEIYNPQLLPFALRKKNLKPTDVSDWIRDRVSNINRTYMNKVYIARKVGRDQVKVLKDSCGISFTDNFWILTSDIRASWKELKKLQDKNLTLNNIALTGIIPSNASGVLDGYTSLFATKGYFPKAIIGGYIYKRKEDSILEYPAYLIGKQLGISVAQCQLVDNYIRIKIFTNDKVSLVHSSELKTHFNTDDIIYNDLIKIKRYDIAKQMQRMFIFNYIIGNPDLHDDNYGLLYNSDNFELLELAPCYDHNVAFQEGFSGLSRATNGNHSSLPLDEWAEMFIGNNLDIVDRLKTISLTEVKKYLTQTQINELEDRIANVIKWGT